MTGQNAALKPDQKEVLRIAETVVMALACPFLLLARRRTPDPSASVGFDRGGKETFPE